MSARRISVLGSTAMAAAFAAFAMSLVLIVVVPSWDSSNVKTITALHNLTATKVGNTYSVDNTGVRDVYAGPGIAVGGQFEKTVSNTGVLSTTCSKGVVCNVTSGNVGVTSTAILTYNGLPPDANGDSTLSGYYGVITDNGPGPNGNQVWIELNRRMALLPDDPNGNSIVYVNLITNIPANTWQTSFGPAFSTTYVPGVLPGEGGAGDTGGTTWAPVYDGIYTISGVVIYTIGIQAETHQSIQFALSFDATTLSPYSGNVPYEGGGYTSQDLNTGTYAGNGPTRYLSFFTTFPVCDTCIITRGMVLTTHLQHIHSSPNVTLAPVTIPSASVYFRIVQTISN